MHFIPDNPATPSPVHRLISRATASPAVTQVQYSGRRSLRPHVRYLHDGHTAPHHMSVIQTPCPNAPCTAQRRYCYGLPRSLLGVLLALLDSTRSRVHTLLPSFCSCFRHPALFSLTALNPLFVTSSFRSTSSCCSFATCAYLSVVWPLDANQQQLDFFRCTSFSTLLLPTELSSPSVISRLFSKSRRRAQAHRAALLV